MLAALDLSAVRRFTEDLKERLRRCDNGEGMVCSNLNESINYYVGLCQELRQGINQWARAIFTTQVAFDPEVENLLKTEARHLLHHAKRVAACGRALDGQCFEFSQLDALHHYIVDLDYLLENWVSPRPAVSPAPRVKMPDAAAQQISKRLEELPALPNDWKPDDPEQSAFFRKQRGG